MTHVINASINKEFRAMENQLEEYKQQTAAELADSITHSEQLSQLGEKVDALRDATSTLKGDLSSLNDSMNRRSDSNPVITKLMELDQNMQKNFTLQLENSFGYIYPVYICGGTGSWRRVVYLNFTDPNTTCPTGWWQTPYSKRTCTRFNTGGYNCDSVTFPVSGGNYTRVCGRIIGYQYGATDAFRAYHRGEVTTIDGAYVEGVSLTHGSPRQHIWTFASGHNERNSRVDFICPCDATIDITIPPFVGGDYFCESGRNSHQTTYFFPDDDPLWDGDGCIASSTCCSFNNPPYFTKQLPNPTSDDIEARICSDYRNEYALIEFIELYVQ